MNTEQPFMIFTTDRAEYSDSQNAMRREMVTEKLIHDGKPFVQIRGHMHCIAEHGWLVLVDGVADYDEYIKLARRYGQESVLFVDANRQALLVHLNTPNTGGPDVVHETPMGAWREIPADKVTPCTDYTMGPDGRTWAAFPVAI